MQVCFSLVVPQPAPPVVINRPLQRQWVEKRCSEAGACVRVCVCIDRRRIERCLITPNRDRRFDSLLHTFIINNEQDRRLLWWWWQWSHWHTTAIEQKWNPQTECGGEYWDLRTKFHHIPCTAIPYTAASKRFLSREISFSYRSTPATDRKRRTYIGITRVPQRYYDGTATGNF